MGSPLLDFIAKKEGTEGHPKSRGYNTTLDYGRWTGGEVDLTGMTLDEIDDLQKRMLSHPENRARYKGPGGLSGSSALGRYQIVRKTMRGLRKKLGLSGNEVFTPELQDKLAMTLAKSRGRNVKGLRSEWQGLGRANAGDILAAYDATDVTKSAPTEDAKAYWSKFIADEPTTGAFKTPPAADVDAIVNAPIDGTFKTPTAGDAAAFAPKMLGGNNGVVMANAEGVPAFDPARLDEMRKANKVDSAPAFDPARLEQIRDVPAGGPEIGPAPDGLPTDAAPMPPSAGPEPEKGPLNPIDLVAVTPPGLLAKGIHDQLPEYWQNVFSQFIKGSSLNFSDEVLGAANAVLGGSDKETFSEEYKRFAGDERNRAKAFAKENPVAATAAEIAGGAAALGPVGSGVGAVSGTGAKIAVGAGEGALIGGLAGAGAADDGERGKGAMIGAAGGAVAGAVLARAGVSLERFVAARAVARAAPTKDAMKAAARQMYKEADKSGIVYKPDSVRDLAAKTLEVFDEKLVTEGLHKKSFPLFQRVIKELEADKPLTLGRLVRLRQLASDAAHKAGSGEDGVLARGLVKAFDDFSTAESNMLVAGSGAAVRKEANAAWHQYSKAETIEDVISKAILQAEASASGGNINNAIRQGFKSLYNNKKRMAGFTAEEREAVRAVVKQGFTADALRLIGKLSFGGNGLMAALNLGAAGATGGTSLIATGAASVAKSMADKITTKRAERVLQMVLSGKTPSRSTIESLTRVERRALARAIVSGVSQPTGDVAVDAIKGPVGLETVQ